MYYRPNPHSIICDTCGADRWPDDDARHADSERWEWHPWWSFDMTPCDSCGGEVGAPTLTGIPNR